MATQNPFQAEATLKTKGGSYTIYRLRKLAEDRIADVDTLPYSIRVLLESCLRNVDNFIVNESDVVELANWSSGSPKAVEVPFKLGRVVLQDFTGVPAIVDLAALQERHGADGGRPEENQSSRAVRSGHRSLGAGRSVRHAAVAANQRRKGIRAEYRALPVSAVGPAGVQQLPGRPARDGHRAPGEPRVPGQGGPHAGRCRLPGHARRDRQSHDDDQWPGGSRLGCRRH